MAAVVFVRLLAIAALLALFGSACGDGNADPAEAAAVAASEAAAVAASEAAAHRVAEADYYTDALSAFERAAAAADRGDAAAAADLYQEAAWHAIAATSATSATEAITAYPLPPGISGPSCTRLAHYHPETSCHFHVPRPACNPEQALIYYRHETAESTGHRYSTVPRCPTPSDAARATKDASHEVLHWQQAASTANAAAEAWQTVSQPGQ